MVACMHIGLPGATLGPCKGVCDHDDCALYRTIANRLCVYCHGRIGYGTLIDLDDTRGESYAHLECY